MSGSNEDRDGSLCNKKFEITIFGYRIAFRADPVDAGLAIVIAGGIMSGTITSTIGGDGQTAYIVAEFAGGVEVIKRLATWIVNNCDIERNGEPVSADQVAEQLEENDEFVRWLQDFNVTMV